MAGLRRFVLLGVMAGAALLVLGSLPLTRHATQGHTDQYNVGSIIPLFQNGGCKPRSAYICTGDQIGFAICGIKPTNDIYGGIVVGWKTGAAQVITGYASRMDYWERNLTRRGCVRIPFWLFGTALILMPLVTKMFARKHSR